MCFVFQAEDGRRDLGRSRGLGDVYKRQVDKANVKAALIDSGYYQAGDFTGLDAGGAAPAPVSDKGKVEVFSWWTGGGEAAGLDAMIKISTAQTPGLL